MSIRPLRKLILVLILIIIDRIFKRLFINNNEALTILSLKDLITIKIVPPIYNQGVSFGIIGGYWFTFPIVLISLFCFIQHILKIHNNTIYIPAVSGGISNVLDRIFHRGVIDVISVNVFNMHLFVCNLADILISLTVIFIIVQKIVQYSSTQKIL